MSRLRASARLLLLGLLLGGCRRDAQQSLTLAGSTSLQPLAERWADAFHRRRPDMRIAVQGGGSTAGVRAAMSGAAQIGMASRVLTSEESRNVRSVAVARDGIALIVHPENPVRDLSLTQIRSLYAGRIVSWGQLGGRDVRATLITREDGSGTRAAFESLVMSGHPILASALVSDSTGAVRQMVGSDPAALGYISIGLVDHSVRALRIAGVMADEANIDSGRYPLVRPFLFVLPGRGDPRTRDFMSWLAGPEARAITRGEGMLPPSPGEPHAGF
jgi:phosphate transport system substrate-binding protein